ncbi:MerR family transcriptional regulator [Mangrovimonas futianensis]|uniref:MerR family transcriptional regulator n=1 Tax=Mangrovimonas futianensis TaxID=2895523 RepID=UPI001E3E46DE|nr:MerR family transcriptional regulator [Mangrovimonas futianensis]MCF1422433.1 MerR family transcriptional regulator [Mangrovimonas futianensis]
MNNIKNEFSIKDLEHLSGIKAHTIRIWEKRYNLFEPNRTETNIRTYSIDSLQKLLNVTALYNNGYKISKISQLSNQEILDKAKLLTISSNEDHILNIFKIATINFDKALFINTYKKLETEKSFSEIFHEVFMPLLEEIGFLWQTKTITPAQEHFISELIKQKILVNTEKYQSADVSKNEKVYALFLPDYEIHELGLQYVNYQLTKEGFQTIYLGGSVPLNSLKDLVKNYDYIEFITYFTVNPTCENIDSYLAEFHTELLDNSNHHLHILGRQTDCIDLKTLPKTIKTYESIQNLVKAM